MNQGSPGRRVALGIAMLSTVAFVGCRDRLQPEPYPPGYPAAPYPPPRPNPVFVPLPIPKPVPVPVPAPPPKPVPTQPTPTQPTPKPAPTATTPVPSPPPPKPGKPSPQAKVGWVGVYSFSEACGSEGSTSAVIGHVLRIFRKQGVMVAEIDADGFQTRTRLRGLATLQENVLVIGFDSHSPDDLFKASFKRGETLLTLVRLNGQMITLWGAYKPGCTSGTGEVFFKRQQE